MSTDINWKNVKLWKNKHETRNGGSFFTYSVSISKKMKDGSYKNKSMKVYPKDGLPEELPNGAECDIEGFMTLDVYTGRDGEVREPMIYANRIVFHDMPTYGDNYDDSFEQLDEDVPF